MGIVQIVRGVKSGATRPGELAGLALPPSYRMSVTRMTPFTMDSGRERSRASSARPYHRSFNTPVGRSMVARPSCEKTFTHPARGVVQRPVVEGHPRRMCSQHRTSASAQPCRSPRRTNRAIPCPVLRERSDKRCPMGARHRDATQGSRSEESPAVHRDGIREPMPVRVSAGNRNHVRTDSLHAESLSRRYRSQSAYAMLRLPPLATVPKQLELISDRCSVQWSCRGLRPWKCSVRHRRFSPPALPSQASGLLG